MIGSRSNGLQDSGEPGSHVTAGEDGSDGPPRAECGAFGGKGRAETGACRGGPERVRWPFGCGQGGRGGIKAGIKMWGTRAALKTGVSRGARRG